jgi:hypothetical protein
VQEEAATLQCLRQLARGVGGEHDEGPTYGGDGAELRDRHLEVGEHLEQQAFHLDVGLVDLVDEQDGGVVAGDRVEQRPGEQELLGEDVVVGLLPGGAAVLVLPSCLDPEQLLLVVPLIKRSRLVQTFVALESDEVGRRGAGDGLRELGLAYAGRALDEQRLLERAREVDRRGRRLVGEVPDLGQPFLGVIGGLEPRHHPSHPMCEWHRANASGTGQRELVTLFFACWTGGC